MSARFRIRIISLCVFFFALIAVVRLFFLQIVSGEDYRQMADRQYALPVSNIYNRGSVFFTEKSGQVISAASLKTTYFIAMNPKLIVNPEDAYSKLSVVVSLDKGDFLAKAGKKNDPYELLAKGLSQEDADKITSLKIAGIAVYKERARVYPAGSLAAHILGFVGLSADGGPFPTGKYGIEKLYNVLLSRDTNDLYVNFFAELFGNIRDTIKGDLELEGDVVLTIEPSVQRYLEKELAAVRGKWSADSAGGVIIEPKTGKIIAMAALPNFDPNAFNKEASAAVFGNPIVENVYEMGSIVKPLTIAAAIDTGAVRPETTYVDEGHLVLNGKRIANFDGKGRGRVTMQDVLNQSLNTGVVYAMQQMGIPSFRTYMRAFGFGEKTGIDLPNEVSGLIKNLESNREVEHATASFGQGIALSPIEMVRALSTLANGGVLMRPYVVDKIVYRTGIEKKTEPVVQGRVLKESTARTVSKMLTTVVDDYLANGKAKIPNYTVAAKTGTAQIANPNGGGYYDDRYLHSFFGYVPNEDARFLTFLYIVHPKGVRYSSETLTEPFLAITNHLIHYYEIPPDR